MMNSKPWLLVPSKSFGAGFCSGVPTGLIILLMIYASFDPNTLDGFFGVNRRCSNVAGQLEMEYMAKLELEREELIKQMLANFTSVSHPLQESSESRSSVFINASCDQPSPKEVVVYKDVVIKEWELPELAGITEEEAAGETTLGEVARRFVPLGTGSFLFVKFGGYRTGPRSFGVLGLGPRNLMKSWKDPQFECSWENPSGEVEKGSGTTHLAPDAEFDGQYVTVVVQCSFYTDVGVDGQGGDLRVVVNHGWGDLSKLESVSFVALTEKAGEYDASLFQEPYKYDYVCCGSSLFADSGTVSLSPQRMREWVTHHMRMFGPSSHFILYDAGGINAEVRKVLDPWLKLGRMTIMNIRQQSRYMNVYHNQFLMLNDCLYRAKTMTKWGFFFDVDEFLNIEQHATYPKELQFPPPSEHESEVVVESQQDEVIFHDLMARLTKLGRKATSVMIQQRPMDDKHCVANNKTDAELESLWAMEKLVYRRRVQHVTWDHWQDHKYAAQVQYVNALGIHDANDVNVPEDLKDEDTIIFLWMRFEGCGNCFDGDILHYYHYHNTVNIRTEVCRTFVDPSLKVLNITESEGVYEFDDTMTRDVASADRQFELELLGPQPTII